MTEKISIHKLDETYCVVKCSETHIRYELNEYFTFFIPNHKFHPKVKARLWDGKIRLFNMMNGTIYLGLVHHIKAFAKKHGYECTVEFKENILSKSVTPDIIKEFFKSLNLPFKPHDEQILAFYQAIKTGRRLILSPTGSGKSLIIYLLYRWFKLDEARTLIIVPSISLVKQMAGDFRDYGYNGEIYQITGGVDKTTECDLVISTWQSIYKLNKSWFNQFDVILGDEAHEFQATSLVSIMTKSNLVPIKLGFTGTLDDSKTNKLVLEGVFGPVFRATSTHEQIQKGILSDLQIECHVLQYDPATVKEFWSLKPMSYQNEINWIVTNKQRNDYIINLAGDLKGNTLVLFQFVEKHGKVLYNSLKKKYPNKPIFYVSGEVKGQERDDIRKSVENADGAIIVASYGTFARGINIKRLHNIIFSSPFKGKIRLLQSIGRILRKSANKVIATVYDISDDLSTKSKKNYGINHLIVRIEKYVKEKFKYKIKNIKL